MILSLDIASTTGFAIFNSGYLQSWGEIKERIDNKTEYPFNLLNAATNLAKKIITLIDKEKPKIVILEDLAGHNIQRRSQRFLDFIHYPLLIHLQNRNIETQYIEIWKWRKIVGLKMSNDDKKHNKLVRQKKAKGKITTKHLSVNLVNRLYGGEFKLKDHNICDAILLGLAFLHD